MDESRRKVLDMLAEGKISVDEAESLLVAVDNPQAQASTSSPNGRSSEGRPKYLRVVVEPNAASRGHRDADRVNVRVPMALLRAGMKLTALIPRGITDKVNDALAEEGMELDLGNLKVDDLEDLIDALADLEVDVENPHQKVRVYVE